ncbi:unnamed protein product [Albugo candida]|uniref:Uncharacterized protein n=1 Tax=Albugo candida TaxID=65357 RepID=A0A024GAT4_9STRA|nr:unnamed protein product [Albugo candida]|eukprot:CCI43412.1 unnamed protein product [Albugo candida]
MMQLLIEKMFKLSFDGFSRTAQKRPFTDTKISRRKSRRWTCYTYALIMRSHSPWHSKNSIQLQAVRAISNTSSPTTKGDPSSSALTSQFVLTYQSTISSNAKSINQESNR